MAETDAKEGSLISDPLDYNFLLIENNAYGDVVAVEDLLSPAEKIAIPPTLLPAGLPPVDKSLIESVREECFTLDEIERTLCKKTQRIWPREIDLNSLYHLDPCPVPTTLQVERNPTTGELLGFYEEESSSGMRLTAKNSCLLSRQPGPPSEAVRGTSTNFPFWPGGMEEPTVKDMMESLPDQTIDFDHGLLTCPPGFQKGMTFKSEDGGNSGPSSAAKLKLNELFAGLDVGDDDDDDENDVSEAEVAADNMEPARSEWLENVLPAEDPRVDISSTKSVDSPTTDAARQKGDATPDVTSSATREEWAVRIDVTTQVSDFRQRVPDMAHQWPFELDTFQKQAVLHLENHQSVFVAAHTSAGKTVVAEYAVALAAKHMTRVIYTSPIKALSNQKFRDFKRTFHDVGLITGDVQISPDAFCLIMTTEILRSMLYNGSDVIRDLEWVIFDEVHYINDAERGVVWEEVLIMLPDHCNVILLSATTPNTMEFANWVGRIKKKKIFVISTLKRPVPLVHYLYTGNSNKTSEEMFLLLDADRKFQVGGYKKACAAKSERQSKHSKSFGAKSQRGGNPASEKGVWLSLINRLRKRDQLPVVAFTFSRRRCDENAAALGSLDLTSGAEKSEVHIFFHKCLQRLKGGDRKLPQVIQMATLLERGVGVHHSGILPILKEVVEMLFARGLVKLLFATETFAMGVNMPARTVVFDSLRKHDGTAMRNLLPGEYIQMAGRAGRRGLDPTGNVILLCKGDVPEMSELHTMMLGKPTKLQSQFRLTYGMIVNLLRVEQLRVEEVMKRSFSEFHHRKDSKAQEERLKQLKEEMELRSDVADLLAVTDYRQYLESCQELVEMRANVQRAALNSAAGVRAMQPGRVLLLSHPVYSHHLAAMLKVNTARTEKTFTCLVLCEREEDSGRSGTEHKWHPMTLLGRKLFRPSSFVHQEVIDVTASEISHVTTHTLTLNAERIIEDHKRRQIPRFKADPPDRSTSVATQELLRMAEDEDGVDTVDAVRDLGIKNMEMVEQAIRVRSLEESISSAFVCCTLPMFHKQILQVEEYLSLLKERDKLSYLLSEESLHLLPEYQQRVDVLKQLRYVDEGGAVQLKGRVACEISTHEIVLTELVFENVFSSLEAPEIVALLSCAVFQQRVDDAEMEQLPPLLREGMKKIKAVAENVGRIQWERGIPQAVEDFVEELKFGLVEVVYEWARGTSFKDITNLTQVQEGMIVRTIQRLHETCRDVRNAARVIGDPNLHAKMELCSELIKRDIVFAASLYTQ